MKHAKNFKITLSVVICLLFFTFLYFFNTGDQAQRNLSGAVTDVKYEKAKVLKVLSESLNREAALGGLYRGTQDLEVKILTGKHQGEVHPVKNYLSNYYNVLAKEGMSIIVNIDSAGAEHTQVSVYNYDRAPILYGFTFLFLAGLWGIGGKKGLLSVLALILTFVCILFLFIPMLYRGYSPIWASVLVVLLSTCITLILLNGWTSKSISAILGTALGIVLAGSAAVAIGSLTHISGLNSPEAESLILIASKTNLHVPELLFSGILISSLGAIMDISISIASAVQEVHLSNPKLKSKELFLSGLNVGRDTMGTMSNTLILAFTGTSLNTLILIYSYNVSYYQLINMNLIGIEFFQGLSGSLGVILTVPIIAFIASRLIPAMKQKEEPVKKINPKRAKLPA
ncbi:YibE/F family protein [Candidatus Formimonas warabiya]|uniref:YibE/F family protein n=1 Tax=Formimonas warabiya TaxID=1761012 RepID=A0A3G1L0A7_FORW1|nr:YibE/F family protein [Candidatus Formimonas warabiya]ATW28222.1 YibE/F family protein [Candidatus Formimonas warabiya]